MVRGILQRLSDLMRAPDKDRAQIYIKSFTFSNGVKVELEKNSIVIFTGPNNAGKSTALREMYGYLAKSQTPKIIVGSIETEIHGAPEDFRRLIEGAGLKNQFGDYVKEGYRDYRLGALIEDYRDHFIGKLPMSFFVSHMGASDRLKLTEPARRKNYAKEAPDHPVLWLELDDEPQAKILSVFEKSFGQSLQLNVLMGENLQLHVIPIEENAKVPKDNKGFIRWINSFPTLFEQGDGMRSFAGAILSLLIHPRNIVLVDEPEAFLHPPQARRLAEVIAEEVRGSSQLFVATHNDEIIRTLLDVAGSRVTIARLTRKENKNEIKVLDHTQIAELWADPLLRTTNVMSCLFHRIAIFCEGESDVRFFKSLMDATRGGGTDIDSLLFHVGGKDKIASVARAMISLGVPVLAIVDIDIISDKKSFDRLYEAFGGVKTTTEKDYNIIKTAIATKGRYTYVEFAEKLHNIATDVSTEGEISDRSLTRIAEVTKRLSLWQRIKEEGKNALPTADALNAFERICEQAKAVGILINQEGELESFNRNIAKTNKSAWLSKVLDLDLATEEKMEPARKFAAALREMSDKFVEAEFDHGR